MKVANNTMISLFGAVRIKCTNVRHWHILYATINRIAAMVGIGIIPANGISTTSTMTSVMECTIPATGVRPPFLMLAAVLATLLWQGYLRIKQRRYYRHLGNQFHVGTVLSVDHSVCDDAGKK